MNSNKAVLRAALPLTIPVFTGFIVLGAAYGILMDSKGFSLFWILFTSLFIYAGSMQFVAVALISAGFDPIGAFFMTLMVNARHLFYGISMLGKFKGIGRIKPYMIFSLTDETFSLLCSVEPPEGIDRKRFMFFISVFIQGYWVTGSLLGGVLGSMFKFNTKGIDFVLTALFVVIFINQWQSTKNHIPALIGILGAILCRIIFGPADFIIPSMIFILLMVTILKRPMERRGFK
ncbi:AzlC family ABC transporter permease [Mobilitalea sibirica]|uniref:AzlC family ABC transporter permease n=1 Tax=Mobilitalea sibirica TaxID=1462919 RepID=A0A8J7HDB0_9FIRM|nr:AzlC family ABC transporter permease [Mobilitalea sibirica]MBH1941872.1 AzlC family ABC transporter permease [Mobilitalea sibirica]